MPASVQETLPEALAGRLTDEQRQAVLEAPRGQRVATVAGALGLTEPDALLLVAAAAKLPLASDIRPATGSLTLLPARLVHDFQIVPILGPGEAAAEPGEEAPA